MKRLSERQHDDAAFRTFEDLEVYKKAREFRKRMYGVARRLADFEKYELGRQIRRASVSLTNNIAEGHGRYHYLDEIKFELQARGSPVATFVGDTGSITISDAAGWVCPSATHSGFPGTIQGVSTVTGGTGQFTGIIGAGADQGKIAGNGEPNVHVTGIVVY